MTKKLYVPKTQEEVLKKFPKQLVEAYLKMVESDYSDKEFKRYDSLAKEFLGKNATDNIARGALSVELCGATVGVKDVGKEKISKKSNKKIKEEP